MAYIGSIQDQGQAKYREGKVVSNTLGVCVSEKIYEEFFMSREREKVSINDLSEKGLLQSLVKKGESYFYFNFEKSSDHLTVTMIDMTT